MLFLYCMMFVLCSSLQAMDLKRSTDADEEVYVNPVSGTLFLSRPSTPPFYSIDKDYNSKSSTSNGYSSDEGGEIPIESDEDEPSTPPNSPINQRYNAYFNEKSPNTNKAQAILQDNQDMESFDGLSALISENNGQNIVLALDFDDTLFGNLSTVDGEHSFPLSGTTDYLRTYSAYFIEALNALAKMDIQYKGKTLEDITQAWQTLEASGRVINSYYILDKNLSNMLTAHKKNIRYLTVLSGFPNTYHKNILLSDLCIYSYLSPNRSLSEDKADILAKSIPSDTTTIIFVDNSFEHAITPFRKKIVPALAKYFHPKENNQSVKIHTRHSINFENELKVPDVLKNEIKLLFELAEKK